jgi:phosphatidylethanolamine-binding protein
LVVNIPGKDIQNGEVKYQYIGSGPPQGSGLHRYIFVVFKQNKGKQDFSELPTVSNRSREGRISTNTRKLIADYNLSVIGGNYYFAQFDDYVPILHAQLGGPPPKN